MRRARDCYGLASKVQLLRAATCPCLTDEKLEAILKRHSYGVDAAAAALLDGEDPLTSLEPLLAPWQHTMSRDEECEAPNAKRPREEQPREGHAPAPALLRRGHI